MAFWPPKWPSCAPAWAATTPRPWPQYAARLRGLAGADWSCVDAQPRTEQWQRTLGALSRLAGTTPAAAEAEADERLIWSVTDRPTWQVQPKVQKRSVKGNWSAGRNASLQRLLHEADGLPYIGAEDRGAIDTIALDSTGWGYSDSYWLPPAAALLALAGHPRVYWNGKPNTPVEVVAGSPQLQVGQRDGRLLISTTPAPTAPRC